MSETRDPQKLADSNYAKYEVDLLKAKLRLKFGNTKSEFHEMLRDLAYICVDGFSGLPPLHEMREADAKFIAHLLHRIRVLERSIAREHLKPLVQSLKDRETDRPTPLEVGLFGEAYVAEIYGEDWEEKMNA